MHATDTREREIYAHLNFLFRSPCIIFSAYYYDSHRWHDDDEVIGQLYDIFLGQVVGSEKRAIQVFYDEVSVSSFRKRLERL